MDVVDGAVDAALLLDDDEDELSSELADAEEKPLAVAGLSRKKRIIGGSLCVLVVVATWVGQAELLHVLGGDDGHNWHPPYQLSYWLHAFWSICLIPALIWHRAKRGSLPGLPWKRLLIYAALNGPVMMLGAMAWYVSLDMTSVSVNTAVYNCTFLFVFAMSLIFLGERFTRYKVLGGLLCLAGLALIAVGSSLSQAAAARNAPLGYLYLVLSMLAFLPALSGELKLIFFSLIFVLLGF